MEWLSNGTATITDFNGSYTLINTAFNTLPAESNANSFALSFSYPNPSGAANTMFTNVTWVRERLLPPNDAMPSIVFNPIESPGTTIATTSVQSTTSTTATQSSSSITTTPGGGGSGSGSGGGGSLGGGGGGGGKPTVLKSGSCFDITNFMVPNYEDLNFSGASYFIRLNYISPTSTGMTVDNSSLYVIYQNTTTRFATKGQYAYSLNLTGIRYVGLLDSVTLKACQHEAVPTNSTVSVITKPTITINASNSSAAVGEPNIVRASTSIANDTIALYANYVIEAEGKGTVRFNTKVLGPGRYNIQTCDISAVPETCSAVETVVIYAQATTSISQTVSIPISIPPKELNSNAIKREIAPVAVGIAAIIIIAAFVYYYHTRKRGRTDGANVAQQAAKTETSTEFIQKQTQEGEMKEGTEVGKSLGESEVGKSE